MTNPFEQQAPAAPAQQPNPFGQATPVQQQAQPAQPQWLAQPTAVEQASYAPAQPQYAPVQQQPQYAAPAPVQQQAAPLAIDPGQLRSVGAPPPPASTGPSFPDMYGRLLLIFPISVENVPKRTEHVTPEQRARGDVNQDRLTANVVVLDDGRGGMAPVQWGGSAMPPKPPTDSAALPYVRKAMWIFGARIIPQLRPFLPTTPGGAPAMGLGRLTKAGPNQNDSWYLLDATQADLDLAGAYLRLVTSGQYPHPMAA